MSIPIRPGAQLSVPGQNVKRQGDWSAVAAVVVVAAVLGWLAFQIPRGILTHTDELLTAERSREMLSNGPWVVHYNFERSFEKPPLQYWLTALTLPRLHNRTLAVRIWPLFYGCLTMIAVALLVRVVAPDRPWLIPLTLAILGSSPLFSREASRGLLDTGLTFFTISTILFAQLARNRPSWWLGAAIACWFGSLQKFPLPFIIWLLILVVRMTSRAERARLRSGWLIGSLILALVTMAIWPLIQITRYGMSPIRLFHDEVTVWIGPDNLGARPYFAVLYGLSTIGGVCGLLSFLAALVVLISKKYRTSLAIREITVITLALIGLTIVSNFRGVRYIVPVVPCLCFLLALVFYRFLQKPRATRPVSVMVLIGLLTAGFIQTTIQITQARKNAEDEKLVAEKLGSIQSPGIRTLLIRRDEKSATDLLWESFYLFHGNCQFPIRSLTPDQFRRRHIPPPLIGVCPARDFPLLQQLYPAVQVELARAQLICWKVPTP